MTVRTRQVRPYSFLRHETLEWGRLRHLGPLLDSVTHRLGGSLASTLRTPCRVEIGEIGQDGWEAYAGQLPDPTFLATAVLAPSGHRVVLHLPTRLAMTIVEIRLGGAGRGDQPDRALTAIEQRLVGEVAGDLLTELAAAVTPALPAQVAAMTSVTSALFLQIPNPAETWLAFPLAVELGDAARLDAQLWSQAGLVMALLDAVERRDPGSGPRPGGPLPAVRDRLLDAAVEAAVRFPDVTLSTEELLGLRPGDVIPLRREPGLPLLLTVDDAPFCGVVPTARGRRLACAVVEPRPKETR